MATDKYFKIKFGDLLLQIFTQNRNKSSDETWLGQDKKYFGDGIIYKGFDGIRLPGFG